MARRGARKRTGKLPRPAEGRAAAEGSPPPSAVRPEPRPGSDRPAVARASAASGTVLNLAGVRQAQSRSWSGSTPVGRQLPAPVADPPVVGSPVVGSPVVELPVVGSSVAELAVV